VIVRAWVIPYEVPLQVRGRRLKRRGWWLRLHRDGGLQGCGDAAPWPGFGAGPEQVAADLEALQRLLPGRRIRDCLAEVPHLAATSCARHALELALLDLDGQRRGQPIAALLSDEPATVIDSHALVVDAEQAQAAATVGAAALKLKLSGSPAQAAARAARIANAAPAIPLRLDANGAYAPSEAHELLERLAPLAPQWVEQPVASLVDFALLRRHGVPLAADESVIGEPTEAVLALADVVVIKPMFLGGLRAAWSVAASARSANRGVCITHALESPVGRIGALHLAAAFGQGVHGLGDGARFQAKLTLPDVAGLGVRALERAA